MATEEKAHRLRTCNPREGSRLTSMDMLSFARKTLQAEYERLQKSIIRWEERASSAIYAANRESDMETLWELRQEYELLGRQLSASVPRTGGRATS